MPSLVRIDRMSLVPVSLVLSSDDSLLYTKYTRNSPTKLAAGLFVAASTPENAPGVLLDYVNYMTEQGVQRQAYTPVAQYEGAYGKPYNFRENVSISAWLEPDDGSDDCIVTQSMLAKALKKACPFNFTSTTNAVTNTTAIPKNTILLHRGASNRIDGMYFSSLQD